MENNYNLKEELKKPWVHISVLFIVLHIINFAILSPSLQSLKYPAVFLCVTLGAMIITLVIVILNPKYSKYRNQFSDLTSYRWICSSVFVVLDLIFLAVLLKYSEKLFFNTLNMALLFLAILHLIVGIVFIRSTPNRLIGLKFSWLLSNELAWKKTHRISAYIWIAFGLIGISLGLGTQVNIYMVLASFLPTIISLIIALFIGSKYKCMSSESENKK
ncbi:SdpI family protein [Paenibacillus macerans]|uniref:SdpI family protein n=1 Tax=Paenibacillus macerans TaxID=44252 RepID=UPI002041AFFC|nr:SdpI family protein [Paenibacillus macerans]MCM3702027.1 SdpI family protein [Paenibacillus macerans]